MNICLKNILNVISTRGRNLNYLLVVLLLFCSQTNFAQQNKLITVIGDSLVGKMVNGESTREVFGNVVLTQDKCCNYM